MARKNNSPILPTIDSDNLAEILAAIGPRDILEKLQEQFTEGKDEEIRQAVMEAQDSQRKHDDVLEAWWARAGWGVLAGGVAAILWVCVWAIQIPSKNDEAYNTRQMTACASGDTVGCIEAVQKQEQYHSNLDRGKLLRTAYKLKTGMLLPSLEGGPTRFGGLDITYDSRGVSIIKNDVKITVSADPSVGNKNFVPTPEANTPPAPPTIPASK